MHHGKVTPEIAAGLLALRKRIAACKIPPSKLDESINIAVWNIREFGKVKRTVAAQHYIAEILGQFDLIALAELRDNLEDLGCVLRFLGPSWRVVYSDWIPDDGGNNERTAFLYDRRAVTFNGLAAELDVPRMKKGDEYLATGSFWRAPYMCSFRSGNFDFLAIAAHARWGSERRPRSRTETARRVDRHPLPKQIRRRHRPHRPRRLQHPEAHRQILRRARQPRPENSQTARATHRRRPRHRRLEPRLRRPLRPDPASPHRPGKLHQPRRRARFLHRRRPHRRTFPRQKLHPRPSSPTNSPITSRSGSKSKSTSTASASARSCRAEKN